MLYMWPVFYIQVWCIFEVGFCPRHSELNWFLCINGHVYIIQCKCHIKILTKLGFSLLVCPTFGEIVQQNRKSPSTVLTAHNSTGSRTFMCNTCHFVDFVMRWLILFALLDHFGVWPLGLWGSIEVWDLIIYESLQMDNMIHVCYMFVSSKKDKQELLWVQSSLRTTYQHQSNWVQFC